MERSATRKSGRGMERVMDSGQISRAYSSPRTAFSRAADQRARSMGRWAECDCADLQADLQREGASCTYDSNTTTPERLDGAITVYMYMHHNSTIEERGMEKVLCLAVSEGVGGWVKQSFSGPNVLVWRLGQKKTNLSTSGETYPNG